MIEPRHESAVRAARGMLTENRFGAAGSRILVEEMLQGREVSFFVLADGREFVELPTCQDYKRAHDGDRRYSVYRSITRSMAPVHTRQYDVGLRVNMMQSTSGR